MEEQAVVESADQESQETSNEVENAQEDNLESLLKEFDEPDQEKPAENTPTVSPDDIAEIRQFRAEREQQQIKSALTESSQWAKEAAGEDLSNMPDWVFEAALHKEAFDNPKIREAFQKRESNPEGWKKITASIGKKIADDFKQTDSKATQSWNAVEGAMHSASTSNQAETPPDFSKMSDSEFMKWKIENG